MSLYVVMNKHVVSNSVVYYSVRDHINDKQFFLGIHPIEKKLYVYKDDSLSDLIKIIDFSDPNKIMDSMPNVPRATSNWIIAQVYKATLNDEYPEKLHFASL